MVVKVNSKEEIRSMLLVGSSTLELCPYSQKNKDSEVDRPEWSGTRPEVKTSVTAMDTVMTWWL